jgi:hypothetical protein
MIVSQREGAMRRAINLTVFAIYIALAVGAPFVADGNWMLLALTPFMLGRATLMCATSPSLAGLRGRLRFSQADALVGYALAYTAAGIWLAIAAGMQLERGLAVVVALGALSWSALWGRAATRMQAESSRAAL